MDPEYFDDEIEFVQRKVADIAFNMKGFVAQLIFITGFAYFTMGARSFPAASTE